MTVTIVPANAGFFVIHARPGETAYEIFSQVSVIAWRIEDGSRMLPEPITPEGVCRRNSDRYPRAVLHPNDSVTSLSGRVVERTYRARHHQESSHAITICSVVGVDFVSVSDVVPLHQPRLKTGFRVRSDRRCRHG